jgi:hypothetical protein
MGISRRSLLAVFVLAAFAVCLEVASWWYPTPPRPPSKGILEKIQATFPKLHETSIYFPAWARAVTDSALLGILPDTSIQRPVLRLAFLAKGVVGRWVVDGISMRCEIRTDEMFGRATKASVSPRHAHDHQATPSGGRWDLR